MNKKTLLALMGIVLLAACNRAAKPADDDSNNCKQIPLFVRGLHYDVGHTYFSTAERTQMGLVMIESTQPGNPEAIVRKYAHPSWAAAGWLSCIQTVENGDMFVTPAPFISIDKNPLSKQNTVYRVESPTGEMNEFLHLPLTDTTVANPYGILGLAYLCKSHTLYASSVLGSDQQKERGAVYAIDIRTKKIIDKIENLDAFGLFVSFATGTQQLLIGSARKPEIYSVGLTASGTFAGRPKLAASLIGLGPRGDDKMKKILGAAPDPNLYLIGQEFDYSLKGASQIPQTRYRLAYDADSSRWAVLADK